MFTIKFLNGSSKKFDSLIAADLRGANLRRADLHEANLRRADLCGANLHGANLRWADLHGASLHWANLRGADLRWADLRGANLYEANLRGANLHEANLRRADLRGADLREANLRGADLRRADLYGADLREADLCGANLTEALGLEQYCILPAGDIVGYKNTRAGIVKLQIPAAAQRVNAYSSRKCRAEYAEVLMAPPGAKSIHNNTTKYIPGDIIYPDSYDPDPRIECSHGIHFFITKQEAEDYAI